MIDCWNIIWNVPFELDEGEEGGKDGKNDILIYGEKVCVGKKIENNCCKL